MTSNIDILLKMISLESLKIISFDVFDTLLIRPALKPSDIFILLDEGYQEITGNTEAKISKIRIDCENELINELGVENVTFESIYDRMETKTNLDRSVINSIKEKELALELELLEINVEISYILLKVKSNKKKVILTSDIYFTSKYIVPFLDKFHVEYDSLYVSADFRKRKDKGDLFDEIIHMEKVLPSEILHIGDNISSDCLVPLKKGIPSFHYVSSYIEKKESILAESNANINKITSLFLGYLLTRENNLVSKENMKFTNLYDFGYYSLGPVVLSMMLYILFSKEIQNTYDILFFSSRDGYLPLKVYNLLRNVTGKGIPGKYIYCGRRALNIAYYDNNVLDYLSGQKKQMEFFNPKYTFDISELFSLMNLNKKYYKENCLNSTEDIEDLIIDPYIVSLEFEEKKEKASQYFNQMLNGIEKGVIFDCGYGGSVSDAIYRLTNKRVNKIYMWEDEKNIDIDKNNGTKTHLLYPDFLSIKPFNLIFEELFSPAEATCIGYEKNNEEIHPILDTDEVFSETMKNDLAIIHKAVLDYTKEFCLYFYKHLPYFDCIDYQSIFTYAMKHLFNERDESISLFSNVFFLDKTVEKDILISLTNKLIVKNKQNSCKGNILMNPAMLHINKNSKLPNNFNIKIGIHLHLFHIEQYIEFLEKLIEFPYPFYLFITYSDITYEKILSICFSYSIIPNLKKLTLLITQNRGRNIGAWLIEMKNFHLDYDIFGHLHTKKNTDIGFGNKWRNYFLVNLLEKNAVIDIMNLFNDDKKLGIVYPPMFKNVYSVYRSVGDPPFQELNMVNKYLAKIKLPVINNCNEVPFSVGTMFWYRPQALNKLFLDNLSYNEFPEEPIGINGTLAHAIERLPSYIANSAGYDTKLYLNPEILSDTFYDSYHEQILLDLYQSVQAERNELFKERNELIIERDGLLIDKASITTERDILLASRSWRITKPLRDFMAFIRKLTN